MVEEPPPPTKRLTRSRHHKVVGGVCGGVGRYAHLDPVIFRVPLAVLSVVGGMGLVAYGVAWLVLPADDEEESEGRRMLSGRVEGPGLTALLVILAGCGLMLAEVWNGEKITWFSTVVLGVLVAAAAWSRRRHLPEPRGSAGGAGPAPAERVAAPAEAAADHLGAPPEAQPPPVPPQPSWWRGGAETVPGATAAERASGYLWGPPDARPAAGFAPGTAPGPTAAAPGGVPPVGGMAWPVPPTPPPAPAEPRELWLGGVVLLLAILACVGGTAAAWWWGGDALGETLVVGLAAALAVFGVGLVVSAFAGRLGAGTIIAVVVTAGLLTGAAALPDNITTHWTRPVWRPETAAEVRPVYEVGSGDAELDLSGLTLREGQRVATSIEAGAGQVRVVVPSDAVVVVHARVGVGGFGYDPDGRFSGNGPTDGWGGAATERTARYEPRAGVEATGTIELDVDLGIGYVAVDRER